MFHFCTLKKRAKIGGEKGSEKKRGKWGGSKIIWKRNWKVFQNPPLPISEVEKERGLKKKNCTKGDG